MSRILIIDDEPMVLRVAARILRSEHEVDCASDPKEALERLVGVHRYDVILCDVSMPQMSGIVLFERACGARPELEKRFVFLTGGATDWATRSFLERPGVRVLTKPFDTDVLRNLIWDAAKDVIPEPKA